MPNHCWSDGTQCCYALGSLMIAHYALLVYPVMSTITTVIHPYLLRTARLTKVSGLPILGALGPDLTSNLRLLLRAKGRK